MFSWSALLEVLLIVTALTLDAFVSAFAYGANKIKIPFSSVLVINLICTSILGFSLLLGNFIGHLLPADFTSAICFVLLMVLGLTKIFDSAVKNFIRKHSSFHKKIRFSAFSLRFILSVYADPQNADSDSSRCLSAAEAAYLAVALSFDSLAVGFGAGVTNSISWLVVVGSLLFDMCSIVLGCKLGNKLAEKSELDLAWLSGIILIVLAVLKIV